MEGYSSTGPLLTFTGMVDRGPFDGSDWMRDYRFRVFIAAPDGGNLHQVGGENAVEAGYPRWDPDGRSLTYLTWTVQRTDRYTPQRIWLDRLHEEPGLAPERLQTLLPADCAFRAVDTSPDGRLLTGLREGTEDVLGFALLTADGTVLELCAREHPYVVNPIWSPDGSAIAFSAAEDAAGTVSGLYVLERASDVIRRIGDIGYHDIFAWCPDSARLCAVDDTETGGYALYVVSRDGSECQHLCALNPGDLSGEIDPAWPAWFPDGRLLAVSTIPEDHDHSVLDYYRPNGHLVQRIEWPDVALLRIDDLQWQPST